MGRGSNRSTAVAAYMASMVLTAPMWVPQPAIAAARTPLVASRAAAAIPNCDDDRASYPTVSATPATQLRFDYPRIHALATGRGVHVAVIDSGVSATPALRGRRLVRGPDYVPGKHDALRDRVGHGTAVASVLAAAPTPGVGLQGLAPEATILSASVTESFGAPRGAGDEAGDPEDLAAAIRWAVNEGARVINMSLAVYRHDDRVARAVRAAAEKNVVVVAAVGNLARRQPDITPYPAAYGDDVIGVGAVGSDSQRQPDSQVGPYVDVMAPGELLTVAAPGRGQCLSTGTSFAAPFVSATAALLRQRFPTLTAHQIADRIRRTADPAPGGPGNAYGAGILNPYRALTETVPAGPPARMSVPPLPPPDPAIAARAHRRAAARTTALRIAGVAVTATAVLVLIVLIVPNGRRRRWRPGQPYVSARR